MYVAKPWACAVYGTETVGCRRSNRVVRYVTYTDVGMKNDPKIKHRNDDPLGHITRIVLFVVLSAYAKF